MKRRATPRRVETFFLAVLAEVILLIVALVILAVLLAGRASSVLLSILAAIVATQVGVLRQLVTETRSQAQPSHGTMPPLSKSPSRS